MLIHALFDNKAILGDGLTYQIYNGYFGGTDASPNITWFNTATLLSSGVTSNLTSLDTASNNTFGNVDNRSMRITGAFYAKKTGTYRFFTRSDDACFIYIDGILRVSNGGTHAAQNKFGNVDMVAGVYYQFIIYYGESANEQEFSAGYLEPKDDGTTSGSSNLNDFIKNGTNLNVYYLTNWSAGTVNGGSNLITTLTYTNPSLYGRYKLDLISMIVDRPNFTTGKDDLFYIVSPQLFQPGSGSVFLVMHEEPVATDFARKDYHLFSDDFEIVTQLNGFIELSFKRGSNFNSGFNRVLLVMQAEKLD